MCNLLSAGETNHAVLETIIADAAPLPDQRLFNTASQAWNHSFFWVSMAPARQSPGDALGALIGETFGDMVAMKQAFVQAGMAHFGSGWLWLMTGQFGGLEFQTTHDAASALGIKGKTPLLACDLWEHAYYLDHQNDRQHYLAGWFDTAPDWAVATSQCSAARIGGGPWRHPAPALLAAPRQ